jgi:hypothetical protein
MTIDKDTITTVVGAIGAIAYATEPIVNTVQGSMHSDDWTKIIFAVCSAITAYFIGKKQPERNR